MGALAQEYYDTHFEYWRQCCIQQCVAGYPDHDTYRTARAAAGGHPTHNPDTAVLLHLAPPDPAVLSALIHLVPRSRWLGCVCVAQRQEHRQSRCYISMISGCVLASVTMCGRQPEHCSINAPPHRYMYEQRPNAG